MEKIKNYFNDLKSNKRLVISVLSICLLSLIAAGISYAAFNYEKVGNDNNIASGHISMTYIEPSNEYIVDNALPVKDEEAMYSDNYFEFTVSSTAPTNDTDDEGVSIPYEITITEKDGNTLNPEQIKIFVTEVEGNKEVVSTYSTPMLISELDSSIYKDEGTKVGFNLHLHRNGNETVTKKYRLRAWIDYNTDVSDWDTTGKYQYKFTVNVNGEATYQGYHTDQSCFAYEKNNDDTYTVIGFNYEKCGGKNIVVPPTVKIPGQYKEIKSIIWPSDDEIVSAYKNFFFEENCGGYADITSCLESMNISEETFEKDILNTLDEFNALIGQNYYDHTDRIQELEASAASLNLSVTIEYGKDYVRDIEKKVKIIKSFVPTTVTGVNEAIEVSNKNIDNQASQLNNAKEKYSIKKTATTAPFINGVIIPNKISIVKDAFKDNEIDKLIDRTGSFPTACFSYQTENGTQGITDYKCQGVKNIIISATIDELPVTTIKTSAFSFRNIASVKFPNTVTKIENSAFVNNEITELNLNDSIVEIGERAFSYNRIQKLTLPNNLTSIERNTFSNNKIIDVKIPDSVKTIKEYAFTNNKIEKLNLGKVEAIEFKAFSENNIEEVIIPTTTKNIGRYAFMLSNVKKLVVPDSLVITDEFTFDGNEITQATNEKGEFPKACVSYTNDGSSITIDTYLCIGVIEFEIPEKIDNLPVKEIAQKAFTTKKLTKIILPDNGIKLNYHSFSGDTLKTVVLPDSAIVSEDAFEGNSITSIKNEKGEFPASCYEYTATNNEIKINKYLCDGVPKAIIPSYIDNKPVIEVEIQNNINIKEVSIPNTVTTLGTFENTGLESLTIPDSVKTIADFSDNNLKNVIIGKGVTKIPIACFANNKLTSITIPDSVTEIGAQAFYNNLLQNVTFGKNLKIIKNEAFRKNKLTEIILPDSLTNVGEGAFEYNDLKTVTIPKNVIEIQRAAFYKIKGNSPSNANLIKIINKTNRAFDWKKIINGGTGTNPTFITGTVENSAGNVEIITQ